MAIKRTHPVMQLGLKPAAMGADVLPCVDGPADGQRLAVCEGDVICVVNPFKNGGGPSELNCISSSPAVVRFAVQFDTYIGHYVRVGDELHWRTDATAEHGAMSTPDATEAQS